MADTKYESISEVPLVDLIKTTCGRLPTDLQRTILDLVNAGDLEWTVDRKLPNDSRVDQAFFEGKEWKEMEVGYLGKLVAMKEAYIELEKRYLQHQESQGNSD